MLVVPGAGKGTKIDRHKLPFMSFRYIPISPVANELTDGIVAEIVSTETRQRRRKDRDLIVFRDCLRRALADLALVLHRNEDVWPRFGLHWPRDNNYYRQRSVPVSSDHAAAVYAGLQRLGYISTIRKGYKPANGEGVVEVVIPTDRLQQLMGKLATNFKDHWALASRTPIDDGPSEFLPAIVVTGKVRENGRTTKESEIIPGMEATKEGKVISSEQEARNRFIRSTRIEGYDLGGWQRQFVNDWQRGGRLYAKPIDYQRASKEERLLMKLNGLPVNEIDIRSSFLFFALARRFVDLSERMRQLGITDPYGISPEFDRSIVKYYINVSIGDGRWKPTWPKGWRKVLDFDKLPKTEAVRAAVLTAYPELTDLTGLDWGTLQKVESDVICSTMDKLRARGIPACPVHDSLIVPIESTSMATMYLEQACREITGFAPPEPKINRDKVFIQDQLPRRAASAA